MTTYYCSDFSSLKVFIKYELCISMQYLHRYRNKIKTFYDNENFLTKIISNYYDYYVLYSIDGVD